MKYFILGLGAVGTSFLMLLKENGLFNPLDFYVVDRSNDVEERFVSLGGLKENFIKKDIDKNNYLSILKILSEGDYLFDFSIDTKTLVLVEYCLNHGIHYLSTADGSWKDDKEWISCFDHYLVYRELRKKYKKGLNTCIVELGMNPGLISCFVKECIHQVILNDQSLYIRIYRKKLLKLYEEKKYGLICKKIKVKEVQEVDNDDQVTNIPFEEDILYSTWNPWSYYYETISSPEIAYGTKKEYLSYDKIFLSDYKNLVLSLYKAGFEYKEDTISPQGVVHGHISTHEEIFSIRDMLTYKHYSPTVHFVYSPCEYAMKSLENINYNNPTKFHIIKKSEIIKGGESVGIILQGLRFKTRYFGNYLDGKGLNTTATILQVSAGVYSAFCYMLKHTREGLLFPEDTDEKEILNSAKKYLKSYDTFVCDYIEMSLGRNKK